MKPTTLSTTLSIATLALFVCEPAFAKEAAAIFGDSNKVFSWYNLIVGPFAYSIAGIAFVLAAISWIQNGRFEGMGLGAMRTFIAVAVILSVETILSTVFGASAAKGATPDPSAFPIIIEDVHHE